MVTIGKIVRSHGIRGELKVYPLTERTEQLKKGQRIFVQKSSKGAWYRILSCRFQNSLYLLQLNGIDSRDKADDLRGSQIQIREEERLPLEAGSFYVSDLIGLTVRTEENEAVGILIDVLQESSQDIFVIESETRELMIPAVAEFIKKIDIPHGEIIIDPIEGLLD